MLPILALAIGLFTLAILALHFYKTEGSFHVFLSFRGPDVRYSFVGHLRESFKREIIRAYIDDEQLGKGVEIYGSLMRAIEDSRIAVVLLSENYASSRWCLDELAKIMERRREGKLEVKPVFYKVDRREVRAPRESFAKALAVHEANLGKDSDKVKRWRKALCEVGSLSVWPLDAKGDEAELVRRITKDVNILLDRPLLDVLKYLVGIGARVLESGEALLFGPWGMGGVGKTTRAKAGFIVLAIGLFALAILALHIYNTDTNKRLSSSLTPVSSSAATDGMGSTFSASLNPEQSPGGGIDCPEGKEQGSYHVFLSFRGPDVRQTFLGHLYDAFFKEGIRAYIDDVELRKGEEIEGSLMRAIEDSRIAVVLLSENYASSQWCLDELAKIMERRKEGKLVVKPVFYKVDPREVRTPRESFAKAFAVHEAKLGKDSDKVKRWRKATFDVGSLSGWHLDAKGHEADLVRSIAKDVKVSLDRPLLDVAKYPGMCVFAEPKRGVHQS